MSSRGAVRDALRTARDNRGRLGAGGALVVVLGVLLGRIAGNRRSIPPVRATGVAMPPGEPPVSP
jgi:hypothetical protein